MFSKQILGIKLEIASPETILSWSYGEVRNGNSFDDNGKPVIDGLFCYRYSDQRIKPNVYVKHPH